VVNDIMTPSWLGVGRLFKAEHSDKFLGEIAE